MFANKGLHTKPLCTLIYIHPKDWLLIPLSPKRRRTPRQKFSSHCVAHLVKKSRAPLIVGSQGCPCFLMRTVAQTPAREEPTLLIEGKSRFSFKEIIKKKKKINTFANKEAYRFVRQDKLFIVLRKCAALSYGNTADAEMAA